MWAMNPQQWPRRLDMAVAQLGRGALEAPWPQASWLSVFRRAVLTSAFLAGGLITGQLDVWVFGAFGALQLGLGEAALPFLRMVRLVVTTIVAMCAVAFVAASLAGTWWTVLLLGAVAFAQGSSVGVGLLQRSVGIGALAMGVIFGGLPGIDAARATLWLAIGAGVQGGVSLLLWWWERARSVRQLLANSVRSVARMSRTSAITGRSSSLASAEVDEARTTIRESGVPFQAAADRVADAVDELRHTVVAWQVLQRPGYADRLDVFQRLRHTVGLLREGPAPRVSDGERTDPDRWPVAAHLETAISRLDDAVGRLGDRDPEPQPVPAPSVWHPLQGLKRGSPELRHGLRMTLAIVVAQAVSLLVGADHSFWIPLTCVFVVKPDWAFTVVRSVARVGGNLLAVLLVPFALGIAVTRPSFLVLLVVILSAVAFRFFTGNYILGSFGIAGTILVLDQTLDPTNDLYYLRFVFTVVGAVIGIAVSALIPARRGHHAVTLFGDVVLGLQNWAREVCRGILDPAQLDDAAVQHAAERERNNALRMRPAVEAGLLEPGGPTDPRVLAVALEGAGRAHLALLALAFQARSMRSSGRTGLDVVSDVGHIDALLAEAAACLGVAAADSPAPPAAPHDCRPPGTDEERAAALETVRLREAASDIAGCARWVGNPRGD